MSILLESSTRVIVQGITGREGLYHTRNMKTAGTNIVGGVTPGKGGTTAEGVPVFDTVAQAKAATDAEASCIFVPPAGAADAIMEAASASISLIVCITEGIPVIDMTRAMIVVREHGARLIGPNCPGMCTPGHGKIGIIPYQIFKPGPVGFISGRTAPPGKRMGHAGAIISGNTGTAQGKVAALQAANVPVADTIFEIPDLVKKALSAL